jgi:hypothetical protein
MSTPSRWKPTGYGTAPEIPEFLSRIPAPAGTAARHLDHHHHEETTTMTKPTSTEKVVPISVGKPTSISEFI